MPPATPPPSRPPENARRSAGSEYSLAGAPAAGPAPGAHPRTAEEGIAGSLALNMADFFAEALDTAIALLHADGGELATRDSAGRALILRARAKRPRAGGIGAPSRPSQPMHPALLGSVPAINQGRMPLDLDQPEMLEERGIEAQSTILLPAALSARSYPKGEGLIGQTWQRGEPIVMSGEEFRAQPHSSGSSGADAPWHLAVPMFRPGPLGALPASAEVIGVIAVYIRDPRWSFNKTQIELLSLHADRIARSLRMAELARQNESRGELMEVLRTTDGRLPDLLSLFPRVRDVVRHLVDAPSFGAVLIDRPPMAHGQWSRSDPWVFFAMAERDGRPVAKDPLKASAMPKWWQKVLAGEVFCVSTLEEHAKYKDWALLGFGEKQPVQSLLVAPLRSGVDPLGALVLGSNNPDAYLPEHIPLIETVAHATAIIVENAQLWHGREQARHLAEEKATNLANLNNAVLTLNASLDLETTLSAVRQQATQLTSAQRCEIFLHDPMEKGLVWQPPRDAETQPALGRDLIMPLNWHEIEAVMATQPFLALDHLESEWHDGTAVSHWLAEREVRSCLVLPLERPEHAQESPRDLDQRQPPSPHLGLLLVYTPGRTQPFSPAEIGLLQGLGSQAAIAISNAKLYDDLRVLDRLKDDFILTVSHEFRTPLTTIDGYVSLIGRHGAKLNTERLEQYGREIRTATDQLASMISTLVDVNRMDSEPLRVEPVPVSARAMAERAIANMPPESKERVRDEVPDSLWVLADAERLPTVFSNLISNALKYGSDTTPCRITARGETLASLTAQGRKVPQGPGAPQRWAVLGVRDFGLGIAETDQHRLFRKFVRLPQTLTTSIRGTGLGLWICKQYISAMGGDIWTESAYGHGAHFQFCLPLTEPPADA
ncbi:MAG TPA: GAF domain-containing protein [Ktedonobacterales bacterium]